MSVPNDDVRCPKCGGPIGDNRSRCPNCRKLLPRGRIYVMLAVAAMVVVAAVGATMFLYPPDPNEQGGDLTNHAIGSGAANFWVAYPSSHPNAGAVFSHPAWVLEALSNGPVLVFAHTGTCAPCLEQLPICQAINDTFAGQITYFDLMQGVDNERLVQAADVYDPTGGTHYVPLTIIASLMKDAQNNTMIVWHSWEGVVSQKALTSWFNDAIAHFEN